MDSDQLKARTKAFALRVIRVSESLPPGRTADVLGKQLLRSGTSVSANYRSACRAKSRADFIHKLSIVEEEVDETGHWMELLVEAGVVPKRRLEALIQEADELTAIIVAAIRTMKRSRS